MDKYGRLSHKSDPMVSRSSAPRYLDVAFNAHKGGEPDCYEWVASENDVIEMRIWKEDRQLVYFCIQQFHLEFGRKGLVLKVDPEHNESHMHRYGRSGQEVDRVVLKSIVTHNDLSRAQREAYDLVCDTFEENRRRYLHGEPPST